MIIAIPLASNAQCTEFEEANNASNKGMFVDKISV
jgi:hypothetical protein